MLKRLNSLQLLYNKKLTYLAIKTVIQKSFIAELMLPMLKQSAANPHKVLKTDTKKDTK